MIPYSRMKFGSWCRSLYAHHRPAVNLFQSPHSFLALPPVLKRNDVDLTGDRNFISHSNESHRSATAIQYWQSMNHGLYMQHLRARLMTHDKHNIWSIKRNVNPHESTRGAKKVYDKSSFRQNCWRYEPAILTTKKTFLYIVRLCVLVCFSEQLIIL